MRKENDALLNKKERKKDLFQPLLLNFEFLNLPTRNKRFQPQM
jgi:hypothetical protein